MRLLPLQPPWNHEHLREYSLRNLQRSLRKHFPIVKLLGTFGEPEPYAYYRRLWNPVRASSGRLLNIVRSLVSGSDGARRDQCAYTSLGKSFRSETDLINMEIPNPSIEEWPFYVGGVSKQCLSFFAICGLNVQTVQQTADIVEHGC